MQNSTAQIEDYGKVITEYKLPLRKLPRYTIKMKKRQLLKPGFLIKTCLFTFMIASIFTFVFWVFFTSPYHPLGVFPKKIVLKTNNNGEYEIVSTLPISAKMDALSKILGYAKYSFQNLVQSTILNDKGYFGTYDEIRDGIHKERFNPQKPYLISGDHFSVFYPRDLGVFYNSILRRPTFVSVEDWKNREEVYINSVFFALESFRSCNGLFTTIVPVSKDSITCIQVYDYPSDSLYSVLYSLQVLENQKETKKVADYLKKEYEQTIKKLYKQFRETVVDPKTNFAKKGIHYSGVKDTTRSDRSFYDAVMIWKTDSLMQDLGYISKDSVKLVKQKQSIINTYWNKEKGYFLEDLSDESLKEKHYSSDWLVVLFTDFLNPNSKSDMNYYLSIYKYIKSVELDKPFGLAYHKDPKINRQVPIVGLFANENENAVIWSFWGSQFAKMLGNLCRHDQIGNVCSDYKKQIGLYEDNIIRFGGYPDVYDRNGEIYEKPFYRSVLQTGRIIDFEDARNVLVSSQ